MTAEAHDSAFAAVSHLPHLLAFALITPSRTAAGAAFLDWPATASATSRASRPAPGDVARHPPRQSRQVLPPIEETRRPALLAPRGAVAGR